MPRGGVGQGTVFAFSPGISESCGQYGFESQIKRGTDLLFQFLPGPSCLYSDPQLLRLPTATLPYRWRLLLLCFPFIFLFPALSMCRPSRSLPLTGTLAHCLTQSQGHISLVVKLGIETPALTAQGVYPGQAPYGNISSVHFVARSPFIVSTHLPPSLVSKHL